MLVKSKLYKKVLFIKLCGELDQHNADLIRAEVENVIRDNLFVKAVFDMEELDFMDSSGIGVLLGRYKKLYARKIPAYITNAKPSVDRVFMMSGIYKLMPKIDASTFAERGTL